MVIFFPQIFDVYFRECSFLPWVSNYLYLFIILNHALKFHCLETFLATFVDLSINFSDRHVSYDYKFVIFSSWFWILLLLEREMACSWLLYLFDGSYFMPYSFGVLVTNDLSFKYYIVISAVLQCLNESTLFS